MDADGEGNPITRYTATASYTGTASSRYATGYTVSANYTGEVSKAGCSIVTYTAIFGSEKAPEETTPPDSDAKHDTDYTGDEEPPDSDAKEEPPASTSDSTEALDTAKEPVNLSGIKRLVMIGVVVLALAGGGVFAFKKFKERR